MLAFIAALVIGTVVATCRVSPVVPLRIAGTVYVEVFRNVPLTLSFLIFYFGFPKIGVKYDVFVSALIVMSIYTGAFVAETVRSGINSVSAGQAEAARSVGLGFTQTLSLIILPQSFRTVTAPLGSLFIAHTKNTSIASVISLHELMFETGQIITNTAQPVVAFMGVAVCYLLITYPAGIAVGMLERKIAIRR